MELYDSEEAIGMRKYSDGKESTNQGEELVPLPGNFINGVASSEVVYMLLRFQILCIN